MKRSDKDSYHQQFADRIIDQIKEGTAPWQKPWQPGERFMPENLSTGKSYRGGNSLYLNVAATARGFSDNRWATYRQIKALGGHVRKGEKGEKVLFFEKIRRFVDRDQNGKPKLDAEGKTLYRHAKRARPMVRAYTVFNAEQTKGLDLARDTIPPPLWRQHRVADEVMAATNVPIRHQSGDRAYYHLKNDEIVLPERGQFPSANHYYQTALHELGHSTGHKSRLGDGGRGDDRNHRKTLDDGIKKGFGSPDYAREELRAEISAMMTGERIGVGHDPARGAAYVEGWIQALEEDPREIHRAAAEAQKISDYVIEPARDRIDQIDQDIVRSRARLDPSRDRSQDRVPDRPGPAPARAAAASQPPTPGRRPARSR